MNAVILLGLGYNFMTRPSATGTRDPGVIMTDRLLGFCCYGLAAIALIRLVF